MRTDKGETIHFFNEKGFSFPMYSVLCPRLSKGEAMESKRRIALNFVLMVVLGTGCETIEPVLQKPSASIQGVKFGNITPESATLLFDVEIENPYSFDLPLVNINYALTSKGQLLFSGGAEQQKTLPAKGKQTVSLPVKVGYKDLFNTFRGFTAGAEIPYKAEVSLSFDTPGAAGRIDVPLQKTGQLTVPNTRNILK